MTTPIFPNGVWNGITEERNSILIDRPPDFYDWNQAVAEIAAIQSYILNNPGQSGASLVSKGFVLGANNPVTVGNNKLPPFTIPGSTTATLSRVKVNAAVSGTISIRIKVNGSSIGSFASGDHESLNINCTSGNIVTVDVVSADGTIQGVTTEMEFLVS